MFWCRGDKSEYECVDPLLLLAAAAQQIELTERVHLLNSAWATLNPDGEVLWNGDEVFKVRYSFSIYCVVNGR